MKNQMIICLFCSGLILIAAQSDGNCYDCFNDLESLAANENGIIVYNSEEEIETMCRAAEKSLSCAKDEEICRNAYEQSSGKFPMKGAQLLLKTFCGSDDDNCCPLKTDYLHYISCYKTVQDELNDCYLRFKKALSWINRLEDVNSMPNETFCAQKWYESCVGESVEKKCGRKAAETMVIFTKTVEVVDEEYATPNSECSKEVYSFEKLSAELCKQENFDNCLNGSRGELPPKEDAEAFLRAACLAAHSAVHCSFVSLELCLTNGKGFESESADHSIDGNHITEMCHVSPDLLQGYKKYEDDLYEEVKNLKSNAKSFFRPLQMYIDEVLAPGIAKDISCTLLFHYYIVLSGMDMAFQGVPEEALKVFKSIAVLSAEDLVKRCNFPEESLQGI